MRKPFDEALANMRRAIADVREGRCSSDYRRGFADAIEAAARECYGLEKWENSAADAIRALLRK